MIQMRLQRMRVQRIHLMKKPQLRALQIPRSSKILRPVLMRISKWILAPWIKSPMLLFRKILKRRMISKNQFLWLKKLKRKNLLQKKPQYCKMLFKMQTRFSNHKLTESLTKMLKPRRTLKALKRMIILSIRTLTQNHQLKLINLNHFP